MTLSRRAPLRVAPASAFLLAGVFLLLPSCCQGQAAQTPPAEGGVATVQVFSRETVIEVTATDAKGQPVRGLTAADLTVEEDGKQQPIRSFQEYTRESALSTRPAPKLPPNIYTNIQPPVDTSAVNILLLDSLNTAAADQAFVKQEAIRYLKTMQPGTRIAVMGLSSRLRLLQGFTTDASVLLAVVDSKKNRSLPSPFIDTDTGDMVNSLLDIVDDGTAASLTEFENEQASFQQDMRNRMTMEALNQIAAYVSGIKGRKNLLWFSAGIPLTIFPTQMGNGTSGLTNDLQGLSDFSKDLRRTTDLLTSAQVAVYPIDARGLFSNPANSAVTQATGLSAKNAAQKGATDAAAQMRFMQKTAQEQLSMEAFAEGTGGRAYYNTNDLKTAIEKAVEDGTNYYSVSYVTPDPAFDGRYHNISIKVNRPDIRLNYRRGYNSDDIAHNQITPDLTLSTTAPQPYGNNMQASMARGAPASSEILFDVRVEPATGPRKPNDPPVLGTLDPKLAGKTLLRYDVEYVVPTRQLTFVQSAGGVHKGSIDFDLAAYDVYGKRITGLSQTLSLPLSPVQYAQMTKSQTPLRFFQQVDLPPGEIFLRVGVLDAATDRTGTLEIPLVVAKHAKPQPAPESGK
jgi:VWFA-related protein